MVGWVRGAAALFQGELGWTAGAASILAALLAFGMLRSATFAAPAEWSARRLLMLGGAAFVLGHAVFLIAPAIFFSPTGMANRALVAGTIGVALIFAAGIAGVAEVLQPRRRPSVLASVIAVVAMLGTLRIAQITQYWAEAPPLSAKVIAAARADLKDVPAGSTIILDNVCPYHGPAVILEAPWDVYGALKLATGRDFQADAVSPRMSLRPNGIATAIYGESSFYPFGERLYVYDPTRHLVVQLKDLEAARAYFQAAGRWRKPCPRGSPGHGVLI